jgi:hypothetical protein
MLLDPAPNAGNKKPHIPPGDGGSVVPPQLAAPAAHSMTNTGRDDRYPIPGNGGMSGRLYFELLRFERRLPGPFDVRAGIGSHLTRLSEPRKTCTRPDQRRKTIQLGAVYQAEIGCQDRAVGF